MLFTATAAPLTFYPSRRTIHLIHFCHSSLSPYYLLAYHPFAFAAGVVLVYGRVPASLASRLFLKADAVQMSASEQQTFSGTAGCGPRSDRVTVLKPRLWAPLQAGYTLPKRQAGISILDAPAAGRSRHHRFNRDDLDDSSNGSLSWKR